MTQLEIRRLNPVIGAEVHGVDLREPISPELHKQLNDVWLDRGVIFFRDQQLSLDQHKDFGRAFGDLHVHPNLPGHPEHPEVLVIHADQPT